MVLQTPLSVPLNWLSDNFIKVQCKKNLSYLCGKSCKEMAVKELETFPGMFDMTSGYYETFL